MTQEEINKAEWMNEKNWKGGWLGIYKSSRDTRVWVPKRNPTMGITVNFAHRAGVLWLLGLVGIPVLITIIVAAII